jgi:tryptophan-rich sensory protein
MMNMRTSLMLFLFVGICLTIGWLGSFLTRPSIPVWYAGLAKPTWTPPNWLFAPMWTALYVLMGVAGWLVLKQGSLIELALPLGLFAFQLLLNLGWSALFFGAHRIGAALLEIAILWFTILVMAILFWGVAPLAGWLLLPYLLWVAYAAALNFAIWRLNS